ncbi:unnamed protein product [Caenorhabditis nigoni]
MLVFFPLTLILLISCPHARCVVITEANVHKTSTSVLACSPDADPIWSTSATAVCSTTTAAAVHIPAGFVWPMGLGSSGTAMDLVAPNQETRADATAAASS